MSDKKTKKAKKEKVEKSQPSQSAVKNGQVVVSVTTK